MNNSSPLYLCIDQGGHASRALVFKENGQVVASAEAPINTLRPQPQWVEHDAEALLESVRSVIHEVCTRLGSGATRLLTAGLATQRSSIVCWDSISGKPLSTVISWQDTRNAEWLAELNLDEKSIREQTGLFASPHYGASKLRWCLDHISDVQRAEREGRLACGPLASFLVFRLTQERSYLCDPCNAARTLLWDLRSKDWSPTLAKTFGLGSVNLPSSVPNRYAYGTLAITEAEIPLTVVTGDQSAAPFAFGQPDPGTIFINVGTGAFLQQLAVNGKYGNEKLLSSIAWWDQSGIYFTQEGTVNGAGAAISRMAQVLNFTEETIFEYIEQWLGMSDTRPLFLNGIAGLGSPYWISDFDSRFVGTGSSEEKMAAVVESVIFLILRNLVEMQSCQNSARQVIITGGLAAIDGLCQSIADLSGLQIARSEIQEATARGLAFLLASKPSSWGKGEFEFFYPKVNTQLHDRYESWLGYMENHAT